MVLELGPWSANDVVRWSKLARRIVVELRSNDDVDAVPPDVVNLWARTLDEWIADATNRVEEDLPFRWTAELEPEMAEYLLHGLHRCLLSPVVMSWITANEAEEQRAFTTLVVRAFTDSLSAQGHGCQEYADQVLSSLGALFKD